VDGLSGDVTAIASAQHLDHGDDLGGLGETLERDALDVELERTGAHGIRRTRRDVVDVDVVRREFQREGAREARQPRVCTENLIRID
jgi:hypothetical protein